MSFLDLYNLRGLKRILGKNSNDISGLQNQVTGIDTRLTSLSNIALKNNLANQTATGLQVTKTPTNDNDVIRKRDIKFTEIRVENDVSNGTTFTHNFLTTNGDGYYEIQMRFNVSDNYVISMHLRKFGDRGSRSEIIECLNSNDNLNNSFKVALRFNGTNEFKCITSSTSPLTYCSVWARKLF